MLDIGWSELLILGVVAILVVGPRELPGMLRNFGKTIGQLRKMAGEFQTQFNDALKDAELDEVRRSINDVTSAASKAANPIKAAGSELKSAIETAAKPSSSPNGSADAEPAGSEAPAETAEATDAPVAANESSGEARVVQTKVAS